MKYLIALVASVSLLGSAVAEEKESAGKGEMKTVCHPKKDKAGNDVKGKDGKVVEECKQVKVRKKLEGTAIPEKK